MADQNRQLIRGVETVIRSTRGDERPDLLNAINSLSEAAEPHLKPLKLNIDIENNDVSFHSPNQWEISKNGTMSTCSATPDQVHNIWLNPLHYMRISLPPSDIIAYLGSASKSLAGCLFWSMLEHSQTACTRQHPSPVVLIQRGLSHSKAIRDIDTSFIQAMINARLEYKYKGSISPKYAPAAEADLPIVVHKRVELDYREMGKDPDSWLSCMAIERRLKRIVGESGFRMLEEAARGDGIGGVVRLMDDAKCRLYDTAVCFGDGPRWDVGVVDEIFMGVLGKLIAYTLGSSN